MQLVQTAIIALELLIQQHPQVFRFLAQQDFIAMEEMDILIFVKQVIIVNNCQLEIQVHSLLIQTKYLFHHAQLTITVLKVL